MVAVCHMVIRYAVAQLARVSKLLYISLAFMSLSFLWEISLDIIYLFCFIFKEKKAAKGRLMLASSLMSLAVFLHTIQMNKNLSKNWLQH